MKKKKTAKCRKPLTKGRRVRTDYQDNAELIDEQELRNRGGIVGGSKHLFMSILEDYYQQKLFHDYGDSQIGAALFIAQLKIIYVKVHKKYKLMEISSIASYLHRYSKETAKLLEEERQQTENLKHKK